MRLSLVPQERRFYALFKKQGELVNESLEQLRNGLLEGQTRHPRLRELEHECDDVTHEIYNLINRSNAKISTHSRHRWTRSSIWPKRSPTRSTCTG